MRYVLGLGPDAGQRRDDRSDQQHKTKVHGDSGGGGGGWTVGENHSASYPACTLFDRTNGTATTTRHMCTAVGRHAVHGRRTRVTHACARKGKPEWIDERALRTRYSGQACTARAGTVLAVC